MTTEMTTREWAASLSADDCETIFHAALAERDTIGVDAALRLLTTKDPHRAEHLFHLTKWALTVAQARTD